MSIANVISSMQSNLSNAYDSISAKGGTIPANKNMANLSTSINSISGGGPSYQRPTDWLSIPTLSGTKDEIYILNGVGENCLNTIFIKISGSGSIDWGDGSSLENFTNVTEQTYSHTYQYTALPSSSWTDHNKTRQALIYISGTRGEITYFSLDVPYFVETATGTYENAGTSASDDVYEVMANVYSSQVLITNTRQTLHTKLEIFNWTGIISNTDLSYMFQICISLQDVYLSNTVNAVNMQNMFQTCYSLTAVSLFDTSNVTNMQDMFNNCRSLITVPLFDTRNVTNMKNMFYSCYSLRTVPLFDTRNVTTMYSMFYFCNSLEKCPLFDTRNVTETARMFYGCAALKSVPLFDTRNVTIMGSMFFACYALKKCPPFNTSNVTNVSGMFNGCYSLAAVPALDMSKTTNVSTFVADVPFLQNIYAYNLNPTYAGNLTLSNLTKSKGLPKEGLLNLFNSLPFNTSGYQRIINLGSTLQSALTAFYVKDSGNYYTIILPTNDTVIQPGKTYYTYNDETEEYTQAIPDFSTNTIYFELVTATWNEYVFCESTDVGAITLSSFISTTKGYTIT